MKAFAVAMWLLVGIAATAVVIGAAKTAEVRVESPRAIALKSAFKNCDRLVVVSNTPRKPGVPFEIKGSDQIAELLELLDFDDAESGFHCMCDGDHQITLYRGAQKVGSMSHHHGRSLRWNDERWDGDSLFRPGVSEAWCLWFLKNGYDSFETMRKQELAAAEASRLEQEKFMRSFPPAAKDVYAELVDSDEGMTEFTSGNPEGSRGPSKSQLRFLAACGKPDEAGLMICHALGALGGSHEGSWSSSTFREQLAIGAFSGIDRKLLSGIFEKAVAEDESALGAARLFYFEDADAALPEAMRLKLAARLARTVVVQGYHGNVSIALRRLTGPWSPEAETLFVELASGALAAKQSPFDDDDEPGARASAILLLAQKGHPDAAGLVEKGSKTIKGMPDRAALAISRAWLGDRQAIKREHFELGSYTLGLSALACLERQGDRDGLDRIISDGFSHPWAHVSGEAVLAVQRITGKTWYKGMKNEREDWYIKDIREWWKEAKATWKPEVEGQ